MAGFGGFNDPNNPDYVSPYGRSPISYGGGSSYGTPSYGSSSYGSSGASSSVSNYNPYGGNSPYSTGGYSSGGSGYVYGNSTPVSNPYSTNVNNSMNNPNLSPLQKQYSTYGDAVSQNAADYGNIMGDYQNLLASLNSYNPNLTAPGQYNPTSYNYSANPYSTSSLQNLDSLTKTGGYTDQQIQDLRARAMSPIRSIYSSAQENIDRQKVLQGGYSPNYTAATAKMARDESQQIADAQINANASIAQNQAANQIQASGMYSNAAGQQDQLQSEAGMFNASNQNQAQQFNIQSQQQYQQLLASLKSNQYAQLLASLQGMNQLYGTTPANSQMFGNQAMNAAALQNQITQQNNANNYRYANLVMAGA